jgi:hypothetical protein
VGSLDKSVMMTTPPDDLDPVEQTIASLLSNDFVFTWSYNGYEMAGDLELGMMEIDGEQVPIRTPADMKFALTQRNESQFGVLRGEDYDDALTLAMTEAGFDPDGDGPLPPLLGREAFVADQAARRAQAEMRSVTQEEEGERSPDQLSIRELTMMERLPKNIGTDAISEDPEFFQVQFWEEAQAQVLAPHDRERRQIEGTDRSELEGAGYKLIFPYSGVGQGRSGYGLGERDDPNNVPGVAGSSVNNWSFAQSLISLRAAANVNEFRIPGDFWVKGTLQDWEFQTYLGMFTGPDVNEMLADPNLYRPILGENVITMNPGSIRQQTAARVAYREFKNQQVSSRLDSLRQNPSSYQRAYKSMWQWSVRGLTSEVKAHRDGLGHLYGRILEKIAASPAALLQFGGVDFQASSTQYATAASADILTGDAYDDVYEAAQNEGPEALAAFIAEQQRLRQEVYASLSQQQTSRAGVGAGPARSITQFTTGWQLEGSVRQFALLSIDTAANMTDQFIQTTFAENEFPDVHMQIKSLWHSSAGRWLESMATTPDNLDTETSGLTWSKLLPFLFPADPYQAYQVARGYHSEMQPGNGVTLDQLRIDWVSYHSWFASVCDQVVGWWDEIDPEIRGPNPLIPVTRDFYDDTYQSYHYYAFSPDTSFVLDYESYHTLAQDDYEAMRSPSENYISINPEYNYYFKEYEEAIAPDDIPEAILPNMYVYSFVTDAEPGVHATQPWQGRGHEGRGDNQAELQQENLDRVITLDEFAVGLLPRIGGSEGNEPELNNFKQNYLAELADKMSSGGITIDTRTAAAKDYYNTLLPASEQESGIYEALNHRKAMFPMYIETSFPTAPPGPIGDLIAFSGLSTSVANAFIVPRGRFATTQRFEVAQNGFRFPSGAPTIPPQWGDNELALMRYKSQTPPMEPAQLRRSQDMQMWSIDDFLQTLRADIDALVIAPGNLEQCRGQCMTEHDVESIQFIEDAIELLSENTHITYEQFFGGRRNCNSETLVYKLIKKDARDDTVIQNFYFPVNNSPRNLINFVDTQVKYNKKYVYELNAFQLVYGSEFKQRVISSQPQISRPGGPDVTSNLPVYFTIAVETIPKPVIVEFPVTTKWRNLASGRHKGVYLPEIQVKDSPPPPPQMQVVPYQNNYRQALFNFQPGFESFIGPRSLEAVSLGVDDPNNIEIGKNASHQVQFENFALRQPKLEFKNEGGREITRIELYSTTTAPATQNAWDITNFNDPVILDISGNDDVEEDHRVAAFDYTATLTPNLKYYYFARSVDTHGNYSNPTPIYEVELTYEKGLYIPRIRLYLPPPDLTKSSSKKMARFLEIKPAKIQTAVINTGDGISSIGLMSDSDSKVTESTFMIRLTSKDTGRKVYFYLDFSQKFDEDVPDDLR